MATLWKKLSRGVEWIERLLVVWLLLVFGVLLLVNVGLRKAGLSGMSWIQETSRYMLVAVTMIGSAMQVKSDGHIKMDLLMNVFGPRVQRGLRMFNALVGMVFWFAYGWWSWLWLVRLFELGKTMESVSIPFWPAWIFFTVPCFFAGVRYIERFVKDVRGALGRGPVGPDGPAAPGLPDAPEGEVK